MAPTRKEIDDHLQIALKEIGEIKPRFDKQSNEWFFSHALYPVEYAGSTKEEVMENFPKYLREFIKHRLRDKIDPLIKKKTKGRGGVRPGAGRPVGSKKNEETETVRLKISMITWIKKHKKELEEVIAGEKRIVPVQKSKRSSKMNP